MIGRSPVPINQKGPATHTCWALRLCPDLCAATIGAELAGVGITEVRTQDELEEAGALPAWLGHEDFHRSHQSSLLRKTRSSTAPVFPGVPDDLPYVWPAAVATGRGAEA